jgi:hypothetical protein
MKRDPQAYKEEFLQQFRHYQSTMQILVSGDTATADDEKDRNNKRKALMQDFGTLVSFMSHVSRLLS